jgi:SAM-dependent methyltransferase
MKPHNDYDSIADLYDRYVTTDYDVPFFVAAVAGIKGRILELASGTGRLSLPLIEAGASLTCIDRSQGMLNILAQKLDARGWYAERHCTDLCQLQLPDRYELALLPFQSFMEIIGEDNQREALAAVYAHLTPGGRFICTLHNPARRRTQVDGLVRVVGRFCDPAGTLVVSGFEQGGNPVVERLQFFEFFAPDGRLLWKRVLPMEFVFVDLEVFAQLAQGAGFHIVRMFGDYDGSPYDAATSPVMIFVLEKPAG